MSLSLSALSTFNKRMMFSWPFNSWHGAAILEEHDLAKGPTTKRQILTTTAARNLTSSHTRTQKKASQGRNIGVVRWTSIPLWEIGPARKRTGGGGGGDGLLDTRNTEPRDKSPRVFSEATSPKLLVEDAKETLSIQCLSILVRCLQAESHRCYLTSSLAQALGPLRICRVLECIKAFLQSYHLSGLLVYGLEPPCTKLHTKSAASTTLFAQQVVDCDVQDPCRAISPCFTRAFHTIP
eukprot:2822114-Amphidinium_carterae.1